MSTMIQGKFRSVLKLFSSILICASVQQVIANNSPRIGEWSTAIANFEIIDYNINDFKMKDSVLEALVKNSGKDINTYLAEDKKTLRIFKVSYRVPIKLKRHVKAHEENIVQFGLFRALDPAMQNKIDIKSTQVMPIQFKTDDPLLLIFVVKDETFNAPALLTDKVKLFKKSRKHKGQRSKNNQEK